jgi:apolipoprotein N-acyltransferase
MRRVLKGVTWVRVGALAGGALPVLAFPRADVDWLAWVALVPGILACRLAPGGREAAVRGWWLGAGFLMAAFYWLLPSIGPGLPLVAVVFGVLWAGWGYLAWAVRSLWALLVLPSGWLVTEYARSWHALGGPWALLGATQWRHPEVLSLASVGGAWLVSFVIVAVNVAIVLIIAPRAKAAAAPDGAHISAPADGAHVSAPAGGVPLGLGRRVVAGVVGVGLLVAGPVIYGLSGTPPKGTTVRVGLVQPGTKAGIGDEERLTATLPPVDLVVWGESSVTVDLDRRPDLVRRLVALGHLPLLVNEDAADAQGRISKTAILIGPHGIEARYTKTRLVPFGEYIPLRHELGWLTDISKAAKQNRVPGTGVRTMPAKVTFAPLICFEAAFPDLGRAVVAHGARLIVYQSSTSTFQGSWAPPQQASLGALRAAETGRPVVQAALTGVSVAFDARGRRLAWLDTDRRGTVTVSVSAPPESLETIYDRSGDIVALLALLITAITAAGPTRRAASRNGGVRRTPRPTGHGRDNEEERDDQLTGRS